MKKHIITIDDLNTAINEANAIAMRCRGTVDAVIAKNKSWARITITFPKVWSLDTYHDALQLCTKYDDLNKGIAVTLEKIGEPAIDPVYLNM